MKANSDTAVPDTKTNPSKTAPDMKANPSKAAPDMKANFNRSALAEALNLLTSVVPSRTPKPILRCVQITADEKEVRMCATDLEVGMKY